MSYQAAWLTQQQIVMHALDFDLRITPPADLSALAEDLDRTVQQTAMGILGIIIITIII